MYISDRFPQAALEVACVQLIPEQDVGLGVGVGVGIGVGVGVGVGVNVVVGVGVGVTVAVGVGVGVGVGEYEALPMVTKAELENAEQPEELQAVTSYSYVPGFSGPSKYVTIFDARVLI